MCEYLNDPMAIDNPNPRFSWQMASDSYDKEDGFGDVGMNSFNHYSLGSVGAWMYHMMAGIREEAPGFRQIRIQPGLTTYVRNIRASADRFVPLGERRENIVTLSVLIPANTTACVYLKNVGKPKVH